MQAVDSEPSYSRWSRNKQFEFDMNVKKIKQAGDFSISLYGAIMTLNIDSIKRKL